MHKPNGPVSPGAGAGGRRAEQQPTKTGAKSAPKRAKGEMAAKTEKAIRLSTLTWSIAEILRGDFKQSEYGKVIMPFVVLRRLDCILESSKEAVLVAEKTLPKNIDDDTGDMILYGAAGDNIRSTTLAASLSLV
jgi:hypothetical protein